MQKVSIDNVEHYLTNATVMKPVSRAVNATDVAINYFEVEPGDAFSTTFHTHTDQEEIFYILSGVATWETEEGDISVAAGDVIRFGPGEYQHGYNAGEETVTAIAIGAPPNSETVYLECPACGEREQPSMDMNDDRTAIDVECGACGHYITEMN